MTHSTAGSVVWKSRRIVGMATINTELSRTTMSAATTTTASVAQRRGSGTGTGMGSLTPLASRGLPAVDDELGTGREGVVVRDQPQRQLRNFVGLRVATERDSDRGGEVVEVVVTHHRRVDDARMD